MGFVDKTAKRRHRLHLANLGKCGYCSLHGGNCNRTNRRKSDKHKGFRQERKAKMTGR